ncbi:MAG: hypothetical protein RSC66_04805, partial [Comamonas sp.]
GGGEGVAAPAVGPLSSAPPYPCTMPHPDWLRSTDDEVSFRKLRVLLAFMESRNLARTAEQLETRP